MNPPKPPGRVKVRAHALPIERVALAKYLATYEVDLPPVEKTVDAWYRAPMPGHPDWSYAFRLVPQEGQPVVAELRVFPTEGADAEDLGEWSGTKLGPNAIAPLGGLTHRILRRISFNHYRYETRTILSEWSKEIGSEAAASILGVLGIDFSKRIKSDPITKGNRLTDSQLVDLAAEYVALLTEGEPTPNKKIAERRSWKVETVRDRLAEARRRELLTRPPGRGMAGGNLTPKGQKLLSDHSKGEDST